MQLEGGQNDGFVYQARAFLEEAAWLPEDESLPRYAAFSEGVHNMEILAAVTESAAHGAAVSVPTVACHDSINGDSR